MSAKDVSTKAVPTPGIINKPRPKVDPNKKLDVIQFLTKFLRRKDLCQDHSVKHIHAFEAFCLVRDVLPYLKNESNMVEIDPPATIIGDIHGHFSDMIRAFLGKTTKEIEADQVMEETTNKQPRTYGRTKFVLLGDYINQGPRSIECMFLLFAFKISDPRRYILLRGTQENHVSLDSDFGIECARQFGKLTIPTIRLLNKAFSYMPLMALVGQRVVCVHGGLSKHLKSYEDVRKIPRPLKNIFDSPLATDLVWSDILDYEFVHVPTEKAQYKFNSLRHKGCMFNEAAVEQFCQEFGVDLVVRSNFCVPYGFRFFANKKLVTIFTATRYRLGTNHGAVVRVSSKGKIKVITLVAEPLIDHEEEEEEAAQLSD